MTINEAIEKQFEFVKQVAKSVLGYAEHAVRRTDDNEIEIGDDWLISPIEHMRYVGGSGSIIKFLVTRFIHIPGSFNPHDGGTPPETDEKVLGIFDDMTAALVAIKMTDVRDRISDIADYISYITVESKRVDQ